MGLVLRGYIHLKYKALIILVFLALLFTVSTTQVSAQEDTPIIEEVSFTDGGADEIDSFEMTKPVEIIAGELLVLIIASDNNQAGIYFEAVANWTKLGEAGNALADCHIAFYYKIADGSENNVIVTGTSVSNMLGWIIRFSGVDTSDSIEDSNFAASVALGTNPQIVPEVTTFQDNCLVLYGLAFDGGDGYPMSVVSPFTEIADRTNTGTPVLDYCSATIGYRNLPNAGPSGDAIVYTANVDGAAYFQVAINGDVLSTTATETTGIFYELFLSTSLWSYFGPLGLVIGGYLLTQKEKALGIFMIIVDSLVIWHYITLVSATPDYWWHIIILVLGVFQLTFQTFSK